MGSQQKIAIVTSPFLGHIHPTIAVGKSLIDLGYDVYWISMLPYIGGIIPPKGKFFLIEDKLAVFDTKQKVHFGMESLYRLYENDLIPLNKHLYEPTKELFCKESFDAVITDHQAFVGAILAYEFNLPCITSVTAPAAIDQSESFPEVINYEKSQIVKLQEHFGIDLNYPLVCSSALTIIYSSEFFLQSYNFPESYMFVGPSLGGRYEESVSFHEIDNIKKGRPIALVTMGSILKREAVFIDKIIEAFKEEDIDIILIGDPNLKDVWPDNFHVFSYIPQVKVMKEVQVVICHGGHNTVCEALSKSVPVIAIPVVNDQSYVATKVVKTGCGLRLKYKRLKPEHLRAAVSEIFAKENYKEAALKVKKSFDKAGGEERAAQLIHEFIIKNERVSLSIQPDKRENM